MQHSPYEIKEKLLQALDEEYNVVDMATVLEVISILEKVIITKDTLEKTRIGKYINELRKRTTNEELAKRAKDLVKSWRRLLPPCERRLNGEEIISNNDSSPASITLLGPGPGPGVGPGPGPGNRIFKASSVPGTPRYKISSPSLMVERSSSPYFSSASNSPLFNSAVLQGSSMQIMPSNYAPVKFTTCNNATTDKITSVCKNSFSLSNQSKNSSHLFKPVSPLLAVVKYDNNISTRTHMPSEDACSPCISPSIASNSRSNSPHTNSSINSCPSSITTSYASVHSSLDISKTNAANKKLRKEMSSCSSSTVSEELLNTKPQNENDVTVLTQSTLSSENSASRNVIVLHSKSTVESDKPLINNLKSTMRRKRSIEKNCCENSLEKVLASLPTGSKLPKVKTTQQLIAELQAKKDFGHVLSEDSLTAIDTLHSSEAEVSQTKSELLKKFLISSQSVRHNNQESPIEPTFSAESSDCGSHSVSEICSVINIDKDSPPRTVHSDAIEDEIKRILLNLPPLNDHIELNDESTAKSPVFPSDDELDRLGEPWEFVNGVYDCNGIWRSWKECSEYESYLGEHFQILPYVNID